MKTIRLMMIAVTFSTGVLSGCSTMTDAISAASGMGIVSEEHSTFDGSTTVSVTPMPLWAKGSWGNKVQLGALWMSSHPDMVGLQMSYRSDINAPGDAYANIEGMDINLDGDVSHWQSNAPTQLGSSNYNTVSRTIYTSSSNVVVIPYALLQRMVLAKDCRLRIRMADGVEDAQFNIERIPGGQGTALLSIRKFMTKVDELLRAQ